MAAKAAKKAGKKAKDNSNALVRLWTLVVTFITEVKAEMIKVSWPTRDEAIASTWVVIGAVVVVALWIFLVDKVTAVSMTGLIRLLG